MADSSRFLIILSILNVIGFLYGIYYYRFQLLETPFYLWIFVTDCPNSALLFAISTYLISKSKEFPTLFFLASSSTLKYGIWTCIVIALYSNYFLSINPILYSILFVAHLLLASEGLFLAGYFKGNVKNFSISLSLLLLNDFFDYALQTHPYIPESHIKEIAFVTLILSFVSTISILKLSNYLSRNSSGENF